MPSLNAVSAQMLAVRREILAKGVKTRR